MDDYDQEHGNALATLEAAIRNPLELGFPALLPMELALRIDTPEKICAAYQVSREEFAKMIRHPVFIKAYQEAVEALKVDGMAFKVKAKLMAEEYLKTAYVMVQDKNTSDTVRADLIKATVRWGGLDTKAVEAGAGATFNIQLNLG